MKVDWISLSGSAVNQYSLSQILLAGSTKLKYLKVLELDNTAAGNLTQYHSILINYTTSPKHNKFLILFDDLHDISETQEYVIIEDITSICLHVYIIVNLENLEQLICKTNTLALICDTDTVDLDKRLDEITMTDEHDKATTEKLSTDIRDLASFFRALESVAYDDLSAIQKFLLGKFNQLNSKNNSKALVVYKDAVDGLLQYKRVYLSRHSAEIRDLILSEYMRLFAITSFTVELGYQFKTEDPYILATIHFAELFARFYFLQNYHDILILLVHNIDFIVTGKCYPRNISDLCALSQQIYTETTDTDRFNLSIITKELYRYFYTPRLDTTSTTAQTDSELLSGDCDVTTTVDESSSNSPHYAIETYDAPPHSFKANRNRTNLLFSKTACSIATQHFPQRETIIPRGIAPVFPS